MNKYQKKVAQEYLLAAYCKIASISEMLKRLSEEDKELKEIEEKLKLIAENIGE